MTTPTVTEPWTGTLRLEGERPLTVNKVNNMHRMAWARWRARVRKDWENLARRQVPLLPQLHAVQIVVTPLHKDRRSPQDVAAAAPEAKAAIDGLVDAGLVPDDAAEYVRRVTFMPPEVCGVDGMQLDITEVIA